MQLAAFSLLQVWEFDMGPIENHKTICRKLSPPGYIYTGYDNGFYLFQSGNYSTGFKEMKCTEEDLTPDNLAFMAEHNLTRS